MFAMGKMYLLKHRTDIIYTSAVNRNNVYAEVLHDWMLCTHEDSSLKIKNGCVLQEIYNFIHNNN